MGREQIAPVGVVVVGADTVWMVQEEETMAMP